MRIEKFVFGPVGTNCYIVINEMTSECFAVDMAIVLRNSISI